MSLELDKRQRAMLREMGIRLWQAPGAAAELPVAARAVARPVAPVPLTVPSASPSAAPPAAALSPTPAAHAPQAAPAAAVWTLGAARALYAPVPEASARWLLLIETPAANAAADPFADEAGKLLNNMLRAAGLHTSARAAWAAVSRQGAGAGPQDGAPGPSLPHALSALVQAEKPTLILLMGRLAAPALLQSAEPLGKLRGQTHQCAGVPAIATYDAAYLLRSLPDKARAWDDLCLAQLLAPGTGIS